MLSLGLHGLLDVPPPTPIAALRVAMRACRKEGYKVILLNSNPVRAGGKARATSSSPCKPS